jgi:hypothetical protein
MTRKDAIAWLRAMGRNASARDWALGETIAITIGEPSMAGEVEVYPGVVYLCPAGDGTWRLRDFGVFDPEESYDDLESAIRGAHDYVGRRERDGRVEHE